MARYMILIFGQDEQWAAMSPEEGKRIDAGHRAFHERAGAAKLVGEQLDAPKKSVTLKTDASGRLAVTDGPFLETKEALGGFYVIEAAEIDEVVALSKDLAEVSGGHSWVEIRPIIDNG